MTDDVQRARPRPREFLQQRRPQYFSDTLESAQPRLDRSLLEYHLDTLTSRSQELSFEGFALALCKLMIAPNLMPHTGPSGGGDSKVDSETYLVDEEMAFTWHTSEARAAATERWAFAFSAKEDWKPKVKSDVAKLAATGRGYTRAYFVSNQYIKDKERSDVEDGLAEKHGLGVTILQRGWILDRVFEAHLEDMAVKMLEMDVRLDDPPPTGPRDASRKQRLDQIERRIAAAVEAGRLGPGVVDDAIEAAVLARGLERSRGEIAGYLERATELASRHGLLDQEAEAYYQTAWTAYWWFEDGPRLAAAIERLEGAVAGRSDAVAVRRLTALFYLAAAGIGENWAADAEWLQARRVAIDTMLDRAIANNTAPSAALSANFTRQLLRVFDDPHQPGDAFAEMTGLVGEADGLLGFDLTSLADELAQLGAMLVPTAEFDALHNRLVDAVQRRAGNAAAASLLTDRAVQLYLADRYVDAIGVAGKALRLGALPESRAEFLRALDVIADSYLQLGLAWAARASWLLAANLLGNDLATSVEELPRLGFVLDRLRAVELRLGRLIPSLVVHRLYLLVARAVVADSEAHEEWVAGADLAYEAALGRALLRLPVDALQRLDALPDALGRLDLGIAKAALLLAFGHEPAAPPAFESPSETADFLRLLRDSADGPSIDPGLLQPSATRQLRSRVLGVEIHAEYDDGSPGAEIAESSLGALEALLATGMAHNVMGAEPSVHLRIRRGHFTPLPFRLVSKGAKADPVEIAFGDFDPAALNTKLQQEVRDQLGHIVFTVTLRAFYLGDGLDSLLGDERALDRSLNFAVSFVTAGDLLGQAHQRGLAAVLNGTEARYSVEPGQGWKASADERPARVRLTRGSDHRNVPHDRIRVLSSVVDNDLWDQAKWRGMVVLTAEGAPPLLALGFTNERPARAIWAGWMSRNVPLDELLQVTIVTDVNAERPFDYRVFVSPAYSKLGFDDVDLLVDKVRIHEMNPESDENLRRFQSAFSAVGEAYLGFAATPIGGASEDIRHIANAKFSGIRICSAKDLDEQDWAHSLLALHTDDSAP